MLTIVGMGIDEGSLTANAKRALDEAQTVVLQSEHMPQQSLFAQMEYETLDALFEGADDYEQLNAAIADRLLVCARQAPTVYAAYGAGLEGQQGAALALKQAQQEGLATAVIQGVSAAGAAAGLAGVCDDYATLSGLPDMLRIDTSIAQVVCGLDQAFKASEYKIRLLELYPPEWPVSVAQLDSGQVLQTELSGLDRLDSYSAWTYAVLSPAGLVQRERYDMADLEEVCRILRAPDGCPWDREQTHFSLKRHLLEECYEVMAAIDEGDMLHVCDELGDVLLQVALHSEIAREHGEFALLDVTTDICTKMIRRHPHVFASVQVSGTEQVLQNWEQIKTEERGETKPQFGQKSADLPPLLRAQKLQKEAAAFGFDWDEPYPALDKLLEEVEEYKQALAVSPQEAEMEAGDVLFAAVNAVRLGGLDASAALSTCCEKFIARIHHMQRLATDKALDLAGLSLAEQDKLWENAKAAERVNKKNL